MWSWAKVVTVHAEGAFFHGGHVNGETVGDGFEEILGAYMAS